jgi:hypothetical protein
MKNHFTFRNIILSPPGRQSRAGAAKNLIMGIFIFACVILSSCEEDKLVNTTGRVRYIALEGGFYGIYGDDGVGYDPINLSTEFQKDSLRVIFEGKILTEQASTHMWGRLIELKKIEKLN